MRARSSRSPGCTGAIAFTALLIGVFSMSSVFADRDVFESLAPPPVATTELQGERHANACRALEQGVRTYLRKEARIERKRCFLVPSDTDWISMEKFVGNELAHQDGKRLSFDWHDPGIDLVAVWSLGRFAT